MRAAEKARYAGDLAPPPAPPRTPPRTPNTPNSSRFHSAKRMVPELALITTPPDATPTTRSWSSLRRSQAGLSPVRIAGSPRRGHQIRELQPVEGTVPFHSPGVLAPLQQPSNARHSRPPTRGATGDCARSLADTMEGGDPHLLPVVDMVDLRAVLELAGLTMEAWPDDSARQLLDELTSLEAALFSAQSENGRPSSQRRPQRIHEFFGGPPLSPHLLLKRRVLYVHVLSECGRHELMQKVEAEDGRVEYLRICARLTDRMAPASYAVSLVAEALGMTEDAVTQLDAHPTVSLSDAAPCAYPGIRCEHTFVVLRVSVEGLPAHGLRSRRVEWAWRPAAASRSSSPRTGRESRPSTSSSEMSRPSLSRSAPRLQRFADTMAVSRASSRGRDMWSGL